MWYTHKTEHIKTTTLRLQYNGVIDKWRVSFWDFKRFDEGKTYYAGDKQDAIDTMKAMVKEVSK